MHMYKMTRSWYGPGLEADLPYNWWADAFADLLVMVTNESVPFGEMERGLEINDRWAARRILEGGEGGERKREKGDQGQSLRLVTYRIVKQMVQGLWEMFPISIGNTSFAEERWKYYAMQFDVFAEGGFEPAVLKILNGTLGKHRVYQR